MRQIVALALWIGHEQPNLIVSGLPVVNYPQTTTLAAFTARLTQLPQASTARNDLAPVRTQGQRELQLCILVVIHQLPDQPRERGRLNEFHAQHYTPLAYHVNPQRSASRLWTLDFGPWSLGFARTVSAFQVSAFRLLARSRL